MDEKFENILGSLPEKRSRSRLEPYSALIKELLRRRRTYREIACILLDRFQIRASISTIHDFVHRWSVATGRIVRSKAEIAQQKAGQAPPNVSTNMQMPNPKAPVILGEVQKRIAELKSRPIPATETKIFHYDPEQPLHISSPPKESSE